MAIEATRSGAETSFELRLADVHLRLSGFELGRSMQHHRFLVGLIERGDVDWKAVDAWLRENVEESWVSG